MAKPKSPNVPADPANANVALSAAATTEPRDNTAEDSASFHDTVTGPSLEDRIAALEAKLAEALSSLEAKVSELDGHVFRLTR